MPTDSVQATDGLLNYYEEKQYDTFLGQSQEDLQKISGCKREILLAIPEEITGKREPGVVRIFLQKQKRSLTSWWNEESSCCGSKPYPGKCYCCIVGVFCSITGVTALCLWYLKDFHQACDPNNC